MAQAGGRETWRFETISVYGGYSPEATTKAVAVPICQTVACAFDSAQHGDNIVASSAPYGSRQARRRDERLKASSGTDRSRRHRRPAR